MYNIHIGLHETLGHEMKGDTHATNMVNKMEYY